jgi:Ca2+:H+ antiporter
MKAQPPSELANGRTIDLSIQFTMFWMPLFILIAWWSDRPFFLLFG